MSNKPNLDGTSIQSTAPLPLEYGRGRGPRYGRPTRLTVIAIIGLIVGVLTIVDNVISLYLAAGWLPHARLSITPRPAVAQKRLPLPQGLQPLDLSNEIISPRGFDASGRKRVIDHFRQLGNLPDEVSPTLDALLREEGQDVLGVNAGDVGRVDLNSTIRDVTLKTSYGMPSLTFRTAATWVANVNRNGSLFVTSDGKEHSVGTSPKGIWTAADNRMASSTLEQIVRKGPVQMTPMQSAAFVHEMQRRDLFFGTVEDGPRRIGSRGTIAVRTNYATLWVDPDGRSTWNPPVNLDQDTFTPIAPPPSPPPQYPGLLRWQIVSILVGYVLSAAAGALLLVVSRLILADAPVARRLGTLYAICEIVISLFVATIGIVWARDIVAQMGLPPTASIAGVIASVVAAAFLACFWAVVLVMVMSSRRVRDFYSQVGQRAIA